MATGRPSVTFDSCRVYCAEEDKEKVKELRSKKGDWTKDQRLSRIWHIEIFGLLLLVVGRIFENQGHLGCIVSRYEIWGGKRPYII